MPAREWCACFLQSLSQNSMKNCMRGYYRRIERKVVLGSHTGSAFRWLPNACPISHLIYGPCTDTVRFVGEVGIRVAVPPGYGDTFPSILPNMKGRSAQAAPTPLKHPPYWLSAQPALFDPEPAL